MFYRRSIQRQDKIQSSYIAVIMLALVFFSCLGEVAVAQAIVSAASESFGSYSGQNDSPNILNCNLNFSTPLAGNHIGGFNSSGYNLILGLDANFGGIGAELTFENTSNNTSVNVIEARSGAGAGWQTSYYLYQQPSDTFIVFNQNAGNSIGYQWGYGNAVSNLTDENWEPLVSDTVTTSWSTSTPSAIATSPCANSGYEFDEGRGELVASPIETSYGLVIHVTVSYDLKSLGNQAWTFEDVEQALYLSKQVAVSNDLRI